MSLQNLAPVAVVAWFFAGGAVELLNYVTRHWSVGRLGLEAQGRFLFGLLAGFVLRLGVTSVILLLAFRHSFVSGLAALMGYWICRWVVLLWLHRRVSRNRTQVSG
jgi:hypothetical protein